MIVVVVNQVAYTDDYFDTMMMMRDRMRRDAFIYLLYFYLFSF